MQNKFEDVYLSLLVPLRGYEYMYAIVYGHLVQVGDGLFKIVWG